MPAESGSLQTPLRRLSIGSQNQNSIGPTQMRLEACHPPQEGLAHLAQIYSIEEEVVRIGRDVNFVNAILRSTKKKIIRTERVRRADGKPLKDLSNLSL